METSVDLRIGYKASSEQFGPRELLEYAVAAEEHGLDSVTVADHYQPWRHEGGHAFYSLSWLSARDERPHANIQVQPGRDRPGVRHHGRAISGTGIPWCRYG